MNHGPSRIAVSAGMCLAMILVDGYAQAIREEPAAQIPFEDFVAKGPAKLTGAEVKSLVSGATTRGLSASGGVITSEFKPDGTYDGVLFNNFGQYNLTGKWRVNETGQVCNEGRITGFGVNRPYSDCSDWYRLDTEYYVVGAGNPAMLRQVKK